MFKKYFRKIFSAFLFAVLFLGLFFFSPTNKISAAGLEIKYPTITIGNQTTSVGTDLPSYAKYLFNIGMLIGFLAAFIAMVVAGIMYFLSPVKPDLLSIAKDRISGAISGLLILVLTYLIVTTINPQLSFLNLNSVKTPTLTSQVPQKSPGVYFYNQKDCPDSDTSVTYSTASKSDLGPQKNKVNSVVVVQGSDNPTPYVSILYSAPNFWGECQFFDQETCQNVSPFASSASIYRYNPNSNGNGVFFYRKSYFNGQGGSFEVSSSEIGAGYIASLEDLKFQNVPKEEQDCDKYDKNENCVDRVSPSLGGENISSIKIDGDYLVLLVYRKRSDQLSGPWTSCQEFPTPDDVNNSGPQQIKWKEIRNTGGVIPNYVVILPIQR